MEQTPAVRRLRTLSGILHRILSVLLVGLPVGILCLAAFAPGMALQSQAVTGLPVDRAAEMPWLLRLGIAVGSIPTLILLVGLARLRSLFRQLASGPVFSLDGARALRDFAAAVLAYALLRPVVGAAQSVLLTMVNPPGQRHLAISLGSGDLVAVLVGFVFLAVSWILVEGHRVAEDSEGIV